MQMTRRVAFRVLVIALATLPLSGCSYNRFVTEEEAIKAQWARMRYNERVQQYNTSRRQFPANMTAKLFGFGEYPFFEAPQEAKQAPRVTFTQP